MVGFRERLALPSPLLLDGATGTELNRRGVDTGLPLWSAKALLEAPEVLRQIHMDHILAGAEVVTANTFRTHARSLAAAGMADRAAELTKLAVEIVQEAVDEVRSQEAGVHEERRIFIAGSMSPLEDCYSPELVPPQQLCETEHLQMAEHLAVTGVDLLLVETHNTIREAQAASKAARTTGLPYGVSFTCHSDGRLISGEGVKEAAEALLPLEPVFMGINCTPTPTILMPLQELAAATPPELPLSAYANIGQTDDIQGWTDTRDIPPAQYAHLAREWMNVLHPRLRLIGGCCGTGPEHVAAIRAGIDDD